MANGPDVIPLEWQLVEAMWAFWIFVFGACIGSFLNVVIYRVPRGLSIVSKPSFCPSCGTPIRFRDNIPIWGWLILRGRCRHCRQRISARYPIVEFFTAVMFQSLYVWGVASVLPPEAMQTGDQTGLGIIGLFLTGYWLPLGRFAFHAYLLSAIATLLLIAWDNQPVPARMGIFLVIVALAVTLLWPALLPATVTEVSFRGTTPEPIRFARLTPVVGGLVGWILGSALYYAIARLQHRAVPRGQVSRRALPWGQATRWSLTLVGVAFGWPTTVIAATGAAIIAMIPWRVLSRPTVL